MHKLCRRATCSPGGRLSARRGRGARRRRRGIGGVPGGRRRARRQGQGPQPLARRRRRGGRCHNSEQIVYVSNFVHRRCLRLESLAKSASYCSASRRHIVSCILFVLIAVPIQLPNSPIVSACQAGAAEAEAAIAALNAQELVSLERCADGASPDAGASSPESVDEDPVRWAVSLLGGRIPGLLRLRLCQAPAPARQSLWIRRPLSGLSSLSGFIPDLARVSLAPSLP